MNLWLIMEVREFKQLLKNHKTWTNEKTNFFSPRICCKYSFGTKITGAKAFWASPWAFYGKIYCLEEKGTTYVIQAGKSFQELGKSTLENDTFWATTAIANGSYIFRGEKAIYCIQ